MKESSALQAGHLPALDAIRGLAILMVMVYHFGDLSDLTPEQTTLAPGPLRMWGQGSFGVDLFFVLSGFLITGILYQTRESARYFRNFYIRRALRIFPLYWGVLFLTFWLIPLATLGTSRPYPDSADHQAWLWFYGTNIFQAWQDGYPLSGFNHFWSLAVEEHFYLVWPFLIYWCSRRTAMIACLVCMLAAVGLRLWLTLGCGYGATDAPVYALTPCRLDSLAVGALLALAVRGPGGVRAVLPWGIGAGVIGGILLAANLAAAKRLPEPLAQGVVSLRYTFYALVFGALLLWAVTAPVGSLAGRFWNSRFLQFFGKYSYGLYVFHYMLRPVFLALFPPAELTRWTGSPWLGWLLSIAASSAATVGVALLSWHLYEKHFLKLKDMLASQARTAAPALEAATVPAG